MMFTDFRGQNKGFGQCRTTSIHIWLISTMQFVLSFITIKGILFSLINSNSDGRKCSGLSRNTGIMCIK